MTSCTSCTLPSVLKRTSPHKKLEPTTNKVIADEFFAEFHEKHDVSNAVFLISGSYS